MKENAADPETWFRPVAPLLVVTALAFLPALANGFVAWDDDANFLRNEAFRGLAWANLKWAWTTTLLDVYQPLSWMVLELQYALWGLDARGYHAASLLLHVANVIVLDLLVVALLERCDREPDGRAIRLGAALAAGLFAAHPLRVEVVAWVSCQPYLPCVLCMMLAMLAYLRAHPEGGAVRVRWTVTAWGFALAAMLFKAVAVSLPALLVILDAYPLRRRLQGPGSRRVWVEKLPFFALAALFVPLAILSRTYETTASSTVSERVARACSAIALYLEKTVAPVGLSVFYPPPPKPDLPEPRVAFGAAAIVALSVGLVLARRRRPGLLAAWAAFLVALAPTLGLVGEARQVAADRYSYLPSIAGVTVLACALSRLARRRPGRVILLAAAGIAGLAYLSWRQCAVWGSTERLFAQALAHGGSASALVRNNLGAELLDRDDLAGAEREFRAALRLGRDDFGASHNLGLVMARRGRYGEAERLFREALRIRPDFAEAHKNLGLTLVQLGRPADAIAELAAAVRLDPDFAQARASLAALLARRHRPDEAIRHYRESLRVEPDQPEARAALATLLARRGRPLEAIPQFREALRLRPDFAAARSNLAAALAAAGRHREADAESRELLGAGRIGAECHPLLR